MNKSHPVFFYRIFGIIFKSTIPLPECVVELGTTNFDVEIKVTPTLPEVSEVILAKDYYCISEAAYLINIAPIARYHVYKGQEIWVHPYPQSDELLLRRYLLSRVLSVLFFQRGSYPLQAAAIWGDKEQGLLLTGKSAYARSILPAHYSPILMSAYLCALTDGMQIATGYPFPSEKRLAYRSVFLSHFILVELVTGEGLEFQLKELKGAEAKIGLLQRNLAYRDVLSKLPPRKNVNSLKEYLKLKAFQLALPPNSFCLKTLLQKINSLLHEH
jgi:hypothetical protein